LPKRSREGEETGSFFGMERNHLVGTQQETGPKAARGEREGAQVVFRRKKKKTSNTEAVKRTFTEAGRWLFAVKEKVLDGRGHGKKDEAPTWKSMPNKS